MASKRVDALKAKEKKQKIVLAVLGVVFLGLMGFQVPRVMKMMKTPPPPHASETTATTTPPGATPSLAAPSLSGGAQPTPTGGGSESTVSNDTAVALNGQLASFSRFASKDPFSQQLNTDTSTAAPSSGGSSSPGSSSGGLSPSGPASSPRPGSAVISVNGTLYTVSTGSDFPQATSADPSATPLFHLVSLTATTAKVSIVGGSYSSGSPTVTLKVNKPVTLQNTADGTRYTLILKPAGTAVPSSGGSGSSSSGAGSGSSSSSPGATTTTSPNTVTLPGP
jgi:hypothetical protein